MKLFLSFLFLIALNANAQETIEATLTPELISPTEVTFHSSFIDEEIQASIVGSYIGGTHNMQRIYANITSPFQRTKTFSYNLVGEIITSEITINKDRVVMQVRTNVGKFNSELGTFEIGRTIYKLTIDKTRDGYKNKAVLTKIYK